VQGGEERVLVADPGRQHDVAWFETFDQDRLRSERGV
jgi:hypothetical protein